MHISQIHPWLAWMTLRKYPSRNTMIFLSFSFFPSLVQSYVVFACKQVHNEYTGLMASIIFPKQARFVGRFYTTQVSVTSL